MFSGKDLSRLIIPLIIETTLSVTVGMSDIIMVAHAGEAAVSGVSLVDSINVLLINLLSAVATGGAIVSSQFLGKGKPERACAAGTQLVSAVTLLSAVIMAAALLFCAPILKLLFGELEAEVMTNAESYFFICAVSYPFMGIYNACAALFRSMKEAKVSMWTGFIVNVLNIGFNWFFIYIVGLDAAGVALGTLISRVVGALITLYLIRKPKYLLHTENYWKAGLDFPMIKRIMAIGIPSGMENSMFHIGKILVAGLITSFGTASIAANAASNTISAFGTLPGTAIGLGLVTIVGQCVGASDYAGARKHTGQMMKLTYALFILTNGAIFLFCRPLVEFYHLSREATDMAVEILKISSICSILIWPTAFVIPNALRASNDVAFTMCSSIFSMWIFRIGFSYLLSLYFHLGLMGTWIAMFIDWAVRSVFFVYRYKKNGLVFHTR
ncbi:MAG: MATE family efflux transporter [Lachnospiraceae bacterium]|nr:MATE family efflux transporter [Lachnospiraceae bacterium]